MKGIFYLSNLLLLKQKMLLLLYKGTHLINIVIKIIMTN